MKKIEFKLPTPPKVTRDPRNRRDDLLNQFEERLNRARKEINLKPLTMAFISSRMAQSNVKDADQLQDFYDKCNNANNFGKYFWWSLRAEKDD